MRRRGRHSFVLFGAAAALMVEDPPCSSFSLLLCRRSLEDLLLAGDGLTGTLSGTRISVGSLPSHW